MQGALLHGIFFVLVGPLTDLPVCGIANAWQEEIHTNYRVNRVGLY
jgi:hypothetical protein